MADVILLRVAKAIRRADIAPKIGGDWDSAPKAEQRRYETMAAAALSVTLRLDAEEETETLLASLLPIT